MPSVLLGVWVLRRQRGHPKLCCLCHPGQSHHCKGGLFSELFYWNGGQRSACLGRLGLFFPFLVQGWKRQFSGVILVLSFLAGWQMSFTCLGKSQCRGFGSPIDAHWILMNLVETNLQLPFYRLDPMGREPMVALAQNLKRYSNLPA